MARVAYELRNNLDDIHLVFGFAFSGEGIVVPKNQFSYDNHIKLVTFEGYVDTICEGAFARCGISGIIFENGFKYLMDNTLLLRKSRTFFVHRHFCPFFHEKDERKILRTVRTCVHSREALQAAKQMDLLTCSRLNAPEKTTVSILPIYACTSCA